ncbi:hypothetical protein RHMOL_Rhmol09G0208600 [Rhododendron molle]|nr:hypothetical protein RHMOL_Rhmol09G0208600 [Rhododendron molle]
MFVQTKKDPSVSTKRLKVEKVEDDKRGEKVMTTEMEKLLPSKVAAGFGMEISAVRIFCAVLLPFYYAAVGTVPRRWVSLCSEVGFCWVVAGNFFFFFFFFCVRRLLALSVSVGGECFLIFCLWFIDQTPAMGDNNNGQPDLLVTAPQLTPDDARSLLSSFTHDQLLSIVQSAALRHPDVLSVFRTNGHPRPDRVSPLLSPSLSVDLSKLQVWLDVLRWRWRNVLDW